jgi:hypothetical protein
MRGSIGTGHEGTVSPAPASDADHRVANLRGCAQALGFLEDSMSANRAVRVLSWVLAATCAVGLVYTIAVGVPDSYRELNDHREHFAAMSEDEREQAFGTLIPTRMDVFDFYRRSLRQDDRYYMQVTDAAFGAASRAVVVRNVARFYLAPAVEVTRPKDATVVLSYEADPGLLPLRYSSQVRAGLQLFFVSRVAE